MTVSDMRESRGEDARRRLVQAALKLLGSGGAEAVSARELGDAAGVSPSAVNYHFGGRDGLLVASMEAAADLAAHWRAESLAAAPTTVGFAALPAWIAALVQDLCDERSVPATAVRELRQIAGRWPTPPAAAENEQRDADRFWTAVAARASLPAEAGPTLSDFAVGAVSIHGRSTDWRRELPWLHESCARLVARLSGRRSDLPGWDGWRASTAANLEPTASAPQASSAAGRMLEAAANIVGRTGAAGLTHRAVAALAGTSLANVTHHFPSRATLLRRTFQHIYDRVRASGRATLDTSPLSVAALSAEMAEALVDGTGALNPGVLALQELMLAATRDPQLRSEVAELRANRGEGSSLAIARLAGPGSAPDRMDAYVTSTMMLGLILSAGAAAPSQRRDMLQRRLQGHFEVLFA